MRHLIKYQFSEDINNQLCHFKQKKNGKNVNRYLYYISGISELRFKNNLHFLLVFDVSFGKTTYTFDKN